MLREIETNPNRWHRELAPSFHCDTVVVGGGIMGLLLAKKLGDLGQRIVLLEASPTLAHGASIKNHGWLHRGTAHAISIKDKMQAESVVKKLIYGYEFLRSYAQECVEEPFEPVYAVTQDEFLAEEAIRTWDEFGVNYKEISKADFLNLDPAIHGKLPLRIFQSSDLRINNRMLFQKLLTDVRNRNGIVIQGAEFFYKDENEIMVQAESNCKINADTFVYCTGANLGDSYRKLTGEDLDISFWKSHLLFLPRFNPFSVVSLDPDQPIIINHREVSVINRAYDEVERSTPDCTIDMPEIHQAFNVLCNMYPHVANLREELRYVACVKPSINLKSDSRHSVNSQIFEPVPGHFFILPGKMTEAPYVADELLHRIYGRLDFSHITPRPLDEKPVIQEKVFLTQLS